MLRYDIGHDRKSNLLFRLVTINNHKNTILMILFNHKSYFHTCLENIFMEKIV